jgi:hypothetical protein
MNSFKWFIPLAPPFQITYVTKYQIERIAVSNGSHLLRSALPSLHRIRQIFVGHGFTGRGRSRLRKDFSSTGTLPVRSTKHLAHPPKQSIVKSAQAECLCYFFRNLFSRAVKRADSVRPYTLRKKCPTPFVIPSEARNLSLVSARQKKERFLASLGMTK